MAPKKPSNIKGKVSKKQADALAAKGLDRNVTPRNVEGVKEVSLSSLGLLRDPARAEEAAALLRRYADEADPNKPGYRGDEVPAAVVRALSQLPTARRAALVEAAGNPEIFRDIPQGFDPLESPEDLQPTMLQAAIEEALGSPPPPKKPPRSHKPKPLTAEQAAKLAMSPSTFAGDEFADTMRIDPRAPIDRTIPGIPIDPATGKQADPQTGQLPPLTPEQEKARQQIITDIVGVPMSQQVFSSLRNPKDTPLRDQKVPVLPQIVMRGGASKLRGPERLLAGATDADAERLWSQIENVSNIPASPDAEPFDNVREAPLPAASRPLMPDNLIGPEDLGLTVSQRPGPTPDAPARPSAAFASGYPSVMRPETRASALSGLYDRSLEMRRRQAAFEANPPQDPAYIRERLDTITNGTLGLQAPYAPGSSLQKAGRRRRPSQNFTVDNQLNESARSGASRVVETLYKAARSKQPVDLDRFHHQWRFQYAIPDGNGGWDIPQDAPSPQFLAQQIAAHYGIENPEQFVADVSPVLEMSIAKYHNTEPTTEAARNAANTVLVPGSSSRSHGGRFFKSEFAQPFLKGMFDDRYPMERPDPTIYSQEPGQSPILDHPVVRGEDPLADPFIPVEGDPLESPQQGMGLRGLIDDDPLSQPFISPDDNDLSYRSMNRLRSGPLAGLYA